LKPMAADDAEPRIRGLVSVLRAEGLLADEDVSDWTRLFRLPCVIRDGKKTSEDPFFVVESCDWSRRLDASLLPDVGKPEPTFVSTASGPRPTDAEAQALLWRYNERNNIVYSDFWKAMEKQLEGQPYHPYIFKHQAFDVSKGDRHESILTWSLSAAGHVIRNFPGATVEHLYALFHVMAGQIEDRDGRHDAWRCCTGAWDKVSQEYEQEKKAVVEAKREEAIKEITQAESITSGVRAWHAKLSLVPADSWSWIKKRMILKEKRSSRYYVMKKDGTYAAEPVDEGSLLPQIIQQGMNAHIPIEKEGKQGKRPMKVADLSVEGFVTNVSDVQSRCEIAGSFIENPNDSESPTLVTLSFRRNPRLTPCYNPDVDLWLRALTGSLYDFFCRHVGCFLAWTRGGVAAMSFNMVPAAGKKLLAHGLLEVLEDYARHVFATGEDLVQQFNGKLRFTPYVFVNEGMPDGMSRYHASDTLRRIVTGDYFQVEGKNKDSQSFKFPFRVLLTANHWRLIDAMGEGRDLSPQERIALGERLVHYPGDGSDAARLLSGRGGERWTKGWIEGDSGEPSRFVVARHFLWLWEHHGKDALPQGRGRLLVEGDPNQAAIRRLRIRGGSTPLVMESIVRLLSQSAMGAVTAKQGVRTTKDGRLLVTTSAILDYWRNNLTRGSGEKLTTHRVALSLKGLVEGTTASESPEMRSVQGEKARFHEIDIFLLAEEAHEAGWLCPELDRLVEQRRAALELAARANGNGAAHPTPSGRLPVALGGA
jgi:hypothetical protein